jgi:hypothetical protein
MLQLWLPDFLGNPDFLRHEVPGITGVGTQGPGSEVSLTNELFFISQSSQFRYKRHALPGA